MDNAESNNEEFIRNLAEDYKNTIEEKNKNYRKLASKHNALFKILCIVYSIFKQCDIAFSKIDYPKDSIFTALHSMIEFGRAEVSSTLHLYLPEESSDEE